MTSRHLALAFLTLLSAGAAAAQAPAPAQAPTLAGDNLKALQRRLVDAGCLNGPATPELLAAATKACPSQEPILQVDAGAHLAAIEGMGVDAQCRTAVTGSDDKTVRLWSMPDGALICTQLLPIGAGDAGKVYAVAMSRDGSLVAAGGWDPHYLVDRTDGVYLFETSGHGALRRFGAFEDVVRRLAFSPSGDRIAVALGGQGGVHVIDVQTGRDVMADQDFAGAAYGLAFGPDGSLFAAADDGYLRRYDAALKRTAKVAVHRGKNPNAIAIDPSGRRLAVGYDDTRAVDLFDSNNLKPLGSADARDVDNGNLAVVAWSRDGERLFAGGRYKTTRDGRDRYLLRSWTSDGRLAGADVPVADGAILNLAACGPAMAFSTSSGAVGLSKPDGVATPGARRAFDPRDKAGEALVVSADATRVRIGLGPGSETPVLFDAAAGALTEGKETDATLAPPSVSNLDVRNWRDSQTPFLGDKPIALGQSEFSRALAICKDKAGFALGADFSLRAFDSFGNPLWARPVSAAVVGVNVAANGQVVLAAYDDGTIRWHRWSDGRELLTLFIDAADRRWVAWTPSGYFMASPDGEDLLGWRVNRGWREPPDVFPVSLFGGQFRRPDIVRLVLATLDEAQAIARADAAAKRREDKSPLIARLPPIATILSPEPGARFSTSAVTVDYALRSPTGARVDSIEALVDGAVVATSRLKGAAGDGTARLSLTLKAPARDFELALVPHAGALRGDAARIRMTYEGATPRGGAEPTATGKPTTDGGAPTPLGLGPGPGATLAKSNADHTAPANAVVTNQRVTETRLLWDAAPINSWPLFTDSAQQ